MYFQSSMDEGCCAEFVRQDATCRGDWQQPVQDFAAALNLLVKNFRKHYYRLIFTTGRKPIFTAGP